MATRAVVVHAQRVAVVVWVHAAPGVDVAVVELLVDFHVLGGVVAVLLERGQVDRRLSGPEDRVDRHPVERHRQSAGPGVVGDRGGILGHERNAEREALGVPVFSFSFPFHFISFHFIICVCWRVRDVRMLCM